MRTLSWIGLLAAAFCSVPAWAETDKYRLLWNQGDPSTSVTVAWCSSKEPGAGQVHIGPKDFGTDWKRYPITWRVDRTTEHKELNHAFARVQGLNPNTKYFFVVRDADGVSERFHFRTAAAGPSSFSVVAGGDSRNHQDARQRANRTVSKLRPLFVCFGGDMTSRATPEEWERWFDDWQLTHSTDGRMYPLVAARGNHEQAEDVHRMFDTPTPDDYYALDFGGGFLRLYTLNSNIVRAGSQGAWLVKDLEAHGDVHWKLAHYHHPFRPHVSKKTEQYAQYHAWAKPFFDHGLNLVIECDSHAVKRTWPVRPSNEPGSDQGFIRDDKNGTVYIGEGCWGAPLREADDRKKWTRDAGSFNQVSWIHVTPEALSVRTVLVDEVEAFGSVDDSAPLTAPEGLALWTPTNGAEVKVLPWGSTERPELKPSTMARVVVVGPRTFQNVAEIRLQKVGGLPTDCEIRYTLDGSEPQADSRLYRDPFPLKQTAKVTATVFANGKALTAPSAETFEKTPPGR